MQILNSLALKYNSCFVNKKACKNVKALLFVLTYPIHLFRNLHVTVRKSSDGRMRLELCKECRLYHCPFCKASVYKPKGDYASVWTHLEIHRMRALKHGGQCDLDHLPDLKQSTL